MTNIMRVRSRNQNLRNATSFDGDAQAYFMEVGLIDPAYSAAINQFILDLKAASLWTKFDRLWLLANANATAAVTCIKSLEAMTPINNPTFVTGQGYAGNGSTSYLNTEFVPSVDGVNYVQNSAAAGYYCRTNPGGVAAWYDMGAHAPSSGAQLAVIARYYDDTAYASMNNNQGSFTTASNNDSIGLWLVSRTSDSTIRYYKNGVLIAAGATLSSNVPTNEVLLCANNSSGNVGMPNASAFTPRQYAMAWFSSGFNEMEAADFHTCMSALRSIIGF